MNSRTCRKWELYGKAMHSRNGIQLLSYIRWGGPIGQPATGGYIVTIRQQAPDSPAVMSATWTPRHTTLDRPVPVYQAISRKGLRQLQERFLRLPGSPNTVNFTFAGATN